MPTDTSDTAVGETCDRLLGYGWDFEVEQIRALLAERKELRGRAELHRNAQIAMREELAREAKDAMSYADERAEWRELVVCCETHIAHYRMSGRGDEAFFKMLERKKELKAKLMGEPDVR